jgi:plastocyanin
VLGKYLCTILIALLGLSITSCSGHARGESQASTQSQVKAVAVDPNTAASITGTISFEGTPPNPRPIDMSNDPGCKGNTESEQVVVNDGRLANVLVYVKSGLSGGTYVPPKQSVSIKQEGCRYVPHMAAVMVGQPVQFEDDDQTLHNIHPMPKSNREWNQSQMPNSQPLAKTFSQPELMIPIKCNQHPWMHMYLSVLGNPYFTVTGKDGSFTLSNLPPGTYTIGAVQEKFGEKTQTITVGAKDSKKLSFSYQP